MTRKPIYDTDAYAIAARLARELLERQEEKTEKKPQTLHLKYWRHPVTKEFTSPIARWSETGLGENYK